MEYFAAHAKGNVESDPPRVRHVLFYHFSSGLSKEIAPFPHIFCGREQTAAIK